MVMRENYWANANDTAEMPINKNPGSPRMWLARVHGVASTQLEDARPHFRTISVAGVWPAGTTLPEIEEHAIYRYFELHGQRVVGMAVCAPTKKMLWYVNEFRRSGALWTWYHTPETVAEPKNKPADNGNTHLDHEQLYRLFDAGMTPTQVARELGLALPSVGYVSKKWRDGKPAKKVRGRTTGARQLNKLEIITDLRAGMTVSEVSLKFDCSRQSVYNIISAYREKM